MIEAKQRQSTDPMNQHAYKIETAINEQKQKLSLRVALDINQYQTDVYEGFVKKEELVDDHNLTENFNSLEQIQAYVQRPGSTELDFNKMVLNAIAKIETKKGAIVVGSIAIKYVQTLRRKFDHNLMEKAIMACKNDEIKDSDIKQMVENMAFGLKELSQDKIKNENLAKTTNERLNRLEDKFGKVIEEVSGNLITKRQFNELPFHTQMRDIEEQLQKIWQGFYLLGPDLSRLKNEQLALINHSQKISQQIRMMMGHTHIGLISAEKWVDSQSSYYKDLKFSDNTFTANQDCENAFVFGSWQLNNQKPHFTVQLTKKNSGIMCVGVISDHYKRKDIVLRGECPHLICHWSSGHIWNNQQQTASSLCLFEDDYITVEVDFKKGAVIWSVSRERRAVVQNQQLLNTKIGWVPYLRISKHQTIAIIR